MTKPPRWLEVASWILGALGFLALILISKDAEPLPPSHGFEIIELEPGIRVITHEDTDHFVLVPAR